MTDKIREKVIPSKPAAAAAAATRPIPQPPSKTSHPRNPNRHPNRHPDRPIPTLRRRPKQRRCTCRRCFCLTCFWSTILLLAVLLLSAIAAAAFYFLYRPQRPSFSVTTVKITSFNLTTTPSDDTTRLSAAVNITLSAKNPNNKATFFYSPISITILSNSITLANGSFTNFSNTPNTIFIIHTAMGINNQILDADSLNYLNSNLKKKNGIPMQIVMDTTVGVKLEKIKMKKIIGIRVKCEGIHGDVPKGKNGTSVVANTAKAKCKVDLKIKIWKWTF